MRVCVVGVAQRADWRRISKAKKRRDAVGCWVATEFGVGIGRGDARGTSVAGRQLQVERGSRDAALEVEREAQQRGSRAVEDAKGTGGEGRGGGVNEGGARSWG